jgi:hypothetical protein
VKAGNFAPMLGTGGGWLSREVSLSCSAFLNSLQGGLEIFSLPKCGVKMYLDNLQL